MSNWIMHMTIEVQADTKTEAVSKVKKIFDEFAEFDVSAEVDEELLNELGVTYD